MKEIFPFQFHLLYYFAVFTLPIASLETFYSGGKMYHLYSVSLYSLTLAFIACYNVYKSIEPQ